MYEDYFGLDRSPFKITPDTSLFYEGGKRGDILAALVYAVHRGEGIIKVVGEVGSGKTMLCRMLQLKLPETVEIIYIANPSVSPEDILFVIAHELSIPVDRSASKHEVMHALQDFLLQRHMENKQVVLFVEEAQGMPIETLEEIRLLSNLETDQHKLLQIILFGQPELDINLANQEIRQLRERITHHFNLEPLNDEEIHGYLNFRMREVGYTGPELVSKSLAKKVSQNSDGLLRRINIIADKILLSAFADGTHTLTAKHVVAAVKDSAFDDESSKPAGNKMWMLMGILLIAAFAFAMYQTRGQWMNTQAAVTQPKSPMLSMVEESKTDSKEPIAVDAASIKSKPPVESVVENEAVALLEDAGGKEKPGEQEPLDAAALFDEVAKADDIAEPVTETETSVAETEVLQKALSQREAQENLPAVEKQIDETPIGYRQWLSEKMQTSLEWFSKADRGNVSIQVLMRNKNAAEDLVNHLRNEWPLDLDKTYVYEIDKDGTRIYRVFFNDFNSMAEAQVVLKGLPESVQVNSPYLHSIYRMQEALL